MYFLWAQLDLLHQMILDCKKKKCPGCITLCILKLPLFLFQLFSLSTCSLSLSIPPLFSHSYSFYHSRPRYDIPLRNPNPLMHTIFLLPGNQVLINKPWSGLSLFSAAHLTEISISLTNRPGKKNRLRSCQTWRMHRETEQEEQISSWGIITPPRLGCCIIEHWEGPSGGSVLAIGGQCWS